MVRKAAAAATVLCGALTLAFGQVGGVKKSLQAKPKSEAVATLASKSGSHVTGSAVFWDRQGKITLHLTIEGAEPGIHAVHIHETGNCSAEDAASAGGHWNPTAESHGKWGTHPFHHGDIGNVEVGADGKGKLSLFTEDWAIGGGGPNDVLGRAVIVHEKADDFTTQPTGNAGGRVACGVIKPKSK